MLRALKQLDRLLRGELTGAEQLDAQPSRGFQIPLRTFVPLAIGLGATYGFFMGWYALALNWGQPTNKGWMQLLAGMVKLPALFLLTLVVTFPSLYVFNALVGTRLGFLAVLRVLVAAIAVNLAVAASLGTILAFFTLSTTSYHFIVLLNVALLAIAGAVGLGFLLKTLQRISATLSAAAPGENSGSTIFFIWVIIYALVGMQMGWLLRPFIGHPGAAFEWFRVREGNFFLSVIEHLQKLLGS